MLTPEWPTQVEPHRGSHVYRQFTYLAQSKHLRLRLFYARLSRRPQHGWAVRKALADCLRADPPELLHCQWSFTYAWAHGLGFPTLVQFCGSDGNGWPGAWPWVNRLARIWSRWAIARADRVLFPNHEMRARFGGPAHSAVLPHGVDKRVFRPLDQKDCRRSLGLDLHAPLVLFAGHRHRPVKRFPLAQAVVAEVKHRRQGAELLLPEGVSAEQMVLYYGAADALLLTSSAEGSPNVVKEALACGCPVVATPVGDLPEYLESVEGSYFIRPERQSAAEMARVLERALSHNSGEPPVDRLPSRFGAAEVRTALLEVYKQFTT
jgi:glycosyltransferase involved in cell wall biosynthesis